jgi:hypothetical protein
MFAVTAQNDHLPLKDIEFASNRTAKQYWAFLMEINGSIY